MSYCLREKPRNQGTVTYKRHRFKDRRCEACGQDQTNFYPKPKRRKNASAQAQTGTT